MSAADEPTVPAEGVAAPGEEAPAPSQEAPAPSEEAPPPSAETGPPSPKPVDDTDDLRGYYFKQLVRRRVTWILTLIAMAVAGVALAIFVGAAVGGGAALAVLIVALIVVLVIADSKSADSFFELYAAQRGLALGGRGMLPESTPLLSKGSDRYVERSFTGPIAADVDGTLALYTYETESTDSKGNRQVQHHRFTVGYVEVPESAKLVPELFCQQKFGFRSLERFEDVFRRSKERVRLESEALDEKYEIFTGKEQDANWLRQLFSPTFIVWLTDEVPQKFAFELVGGNLCCYVHGHKDHAEQLDVVCAASGSVARRIAEEASE
jgi:hypothetical protein